MCKIFLPPPSRLALCHRNPHALSNNSNGSKVYSVRFTKELLGFSDSVGHGKKSVNSSLYSLIKVSSFCTMQKRSLQLTVKMQLILFVSKYTSIVFFTVLSFKIC